MLACECRLSCECRVEGFRNGLGKSSFQVSFKGTFVLKVSSSLSRVPLTSLGVVSVSWVNFWCFGADV